MNKQIGLRVSLMIILVVASLATARAADFYVRGDGSGSDANSGADWNNAFATLQMALDNLSGGTHSIYVQESTGTQRYNAAGRNTNFGGITVTFQGGWSNVDVSPVQTGRSHISDLIGPVDQIGLQLRSTGGAHGQPITATVNRLDFSDVTTGIQFLNPGNVDSSRINVTLTNSEITALQHGVTVNYNKSPSGGGGITFSGDGLIVRAGQGAATGHGLDLTGLFTVGSLAVSNADITSAAEHGIYLDYSGGSGCCFHSSWDMTVSNTVIHNSAGDGIHLIDNTDNAWSGGVVNTIELDKVVLANNVGHGLFGHQDARSAGEVRPLLIEAVNSLITSNGGDGIHLFGNADATGATTQVDLQNVVVAFNLGDGVYAESSLAAIAEVFNSIIAFNGGDGLDLNDPTGPSLTEDFNDFFGHPGDDILLNAIAAALSANDFNVDPSFVGSGSNPFQLLAGSPLLLAGDPTGAPADDILGVVRSLTNPSIGAYEVGFESNAVPEPASIILWSLLALVGGVCLWSGTRVGLVKRA